MKVLQALAATLTELGVADAFTFTAEDIVDLVAELDLRGVSVYHTRHEHTAVGMADGYARVTGRTGVAIVGAGVGLTNTLNALLTAAKANSSVLVIAGEVPGIDSPAARLQRKYVDQRALLTAVGVRHIDLVDAASAAADLVAAFEAADRGATIVVNVPDDLLREEVSDAPARIGSPPPSLSAPQDDDIERVLERIRAADRIVVLAGRGAVRAGARDELVALADSAGALLATSLMAQGLFAGSAWNVGVLGGFASPAAVELVAEADLVLAFGASLNYDTTGDGALFPRAKVVHVDRDAAAFGRFGDAELAVVGDACLVAAGLTARLATDHRGAGFRSADVAERIARQDGPSFDDVSGPDGLDPRTLMTTLDRHLPAERAVVVDGGSQKRWPVRYLRVPDERAFVWPTEYGSIGGGIGAALGAAVARPDRPTVLCIGDGALMMSLADLDTAPRYGLPLLIVVSNNFGLGAEYHHLVARGYSGDQMRYPNRPFADLAVSLGFEARTVRTLDELDAVVADLRQISRPTLLDCHVTIERVEPGWRVIAREKARTGPSSS